MGKKEIASGAEGLRCVNRDLGWSRHLDTLISIERVSKTALKGQCFSTVPSSGNFGSSL
jgi:hypothetical protein